MPTLQFRIHTSSHCDISLNVSSVPVIESCSSLTFRPPSNIETPDHGPGDDPGNRLNRVAEVADFSWIKSSPSPNWTYRDEPFDHEVLENLSNGHIDIETTVHDVLDRVLR